MDETNCDWVDNWVLYFSVTQNYKSQIYLQAKTRRFGYNEPSSGWLAKKKKSPVQQSWCPYVIRTNEQDTWLDTMYLCAKWHNNFSGGVLTLPSSFALTKMSPRLGFFLGALITRAWLGTSQPGCITLKCSCMPLKNGVIPMEGTDKREE